MTKTHKDRDGVLICDGCERPVTWMQSKAGKYYLVNATKGIINTSTRFEYKTEVVSAPSTKIPHFKSCDAELRKIMQARKEEN